MIKLFKPLPPVCFSLFVGYKSYDLEIGKEVVFGGWGEWDFGLFGMIQRKLFSINIMLNSLMMGFV